MMRILALEPYYGGSHKAFLDGWREHSRHDWTVLGLPAYKWKWRMRHSAITFAEEVESRAMSGEAWDLVLCSDMLNLAEFLGLVPQLVQEVPSIAYFHENQLTYPVRHDSERDYQFALTNLTTALAATGVWFNTAYHRRSFLAALDRFLKRMPDFQPFDAIERIRAKSSVCPPGIPPSRDREERKPGPMRILWAARWEHDKDPDAFFQALERLKTREVDFRVSVIGERFRDCPLSFERARESFSGQIDRWGYQESRMDYESALREADVFVSTASHEFFGIGAVEAAGAGAFPLLPPRLSYPEVFGSSGEAEDFFYDGSVEGLADRLADLAARLEIGDLWRGDPERGSRLVERFHWDRLVPELDERLAQVAMPAR